MNERHLTELSLGGGSSLQGRCGSRKQMLMMFEHDGKIVCHVYPEGYDHTHYGHLICDLVRHLSHTFKVEEDEIWERIEKERRQPTTEITQPS